MGTWRLFAKYSFNSSVLPPVEKNAKTCDKSLLN